MLFSQLRAVRRLHTLHTLYNVIYDIDYRITGTMCRTPIYSVAKSDPVGSGIICFGSGSSKNERADKLYIGTCSTVPVSLKMFKIFFKCEIEIGR